MEAEKVVETLAFCSTMTRLIAREDFCVFIRREQFKPYTKFEIAP
jgi:hypothetical protein